MYRTIIQALFALISISTASANDVLGCGGFIKSHVPIDFSKVEIKLLTKQGILKDRTNCAPNGYYFLPLYDKGEYILKLEPPAGWSFNPTNIHIKVDGSDSCSLGKDINFSFKGFGITGKVQSLGLKDGPAGIPVELKSDSETRHTTTTEGGNFFFTPVYPGQYKVSISQSIYKAFKDSIQVTVKQGNTELALDSLIIQGYNVVGRVENEGEPVENTIIVLHSSENKKDVPVLVDGCQKDELLSVNKKKPLCHVKTDKNGLFKFGTIPPGKYYVSPYSGNQQNIYFRPESLQFEVGHQSVTISDTFEVIGFSLIGSVLKSSNGKPLSDAVIYLNDKEIMKTDGNGEYKLEKLKAGTYQISVKAFGYEFKDTQIQLSPNMQKIPSIAPFSYRICGTVLSEKEELVQIKTIGGTGDREYIARTIPNTGTFCEYLPPGNYQAQVQISEGEAAKGIQFYPFVFNFEVTHQQVDNIIFSQLKAEISGRVKCFRSSDCASLKVSLHSDLAGSDRSEVIVAVEDGNYKINDIYPGNYEVIIHSNQLCWKKQKHTFTVNSKKVSVPDFEQSGYSITFISSHQAAISYKKSEVTRSFEISKGRTSQCLEKPGKYLFNLSGCHVYESNTIEYDTDSGVVELFLNAVKHQVTLAVESDKFHGDLFVNINSKSGKKLVGPLTYNDRNYKLQFSLAPGETVVIVPQSEILYFNPPLVALVGTHDCQDLGAKFTAKKGKFFAGIIKPPLPGVIVSIQSDSSDDPLVTETDHTGTYKFQPLDDSKEYKITARKENYILTGPDKNGDFLAHKLAEITVKVIDEADKSSLQGCLLSLSGGHSYRSNLQTNDDGKITFNSLSPGEYFLRPMMKEYSFNPSSKSITIKEGESVEVSLIGKRVAYSAYGSVVSLSGEPEENVIVIAQGVDECNHYSEEATSDRIGSYRIRGLQPSCSYDLRVSGVAGNAYVIERSAPHSIRLEKMSKDVRNLTTIVFRPSTNMDILVKVYAENPDHYKTLKLNLYRETAPSSLVHAMKVDSSFIKMTKDNNPGVLLHLPSILMDGKSYSLQLDSSLPIKSNMPVEYFTAVSSFRYFDFTFVVKSTVNEEHIKQTPVWALVFFLILIFVIYNIDAIITVVKERLNGNININLKNFSGKTGSSPQDNTDIDQLVDSINAVKRKTKPKRI